METNAIDGLGLCDVLPDELICDLMCFYLDEKALNECQQVCKRWNLLLKEYVWRRKAELCLQRKCPHSDLLTWREYRAIFMYDLFDRNLVQNHSGENGLEANWEEWIHGGHSWNIECPPVGAPSLPIETGFNEDRCFVTSYDTCSKCYTVDLIGNHFMPAILDDLQPPIEVRRAHFSTYSVSL